jgi:hypothetical protein
MAEMGCLRISDWCRPFAIPWKEALFIGHSRGLDGGISDRELHGRALEPVVGQRVSGRKHMRGRAMRRRIKVKERLLAISQQSASHRNICRNGDDYLVAIVRRSKSFLLAGSTLLMFVSLIVIQTTARAQEGFRPSAQDSTLTDATQPAQASTPSRANDSVPAGTGRLLGTVLDKNRDVLQGARVTLRAHRVLP